MYLKGSKWSYSRRKKRSNPWFVLFLIAAVGGMLYINTIVVPAVGPIGVPTSTPTRSPESFVSDAENLLSQGKMALAINAYNQAIQADPKNPSNFIALARLQVFSGDYKAAVTNAENALILDPNNSMAMAIRGWAKGFLGDYLAAEGSISKSIQVEANNAVAYAYLAEVISLEIQDGKQTIGATEKMIQASKTAQQLGPNLFETHRARGLVLENTQNNEEAVTEFEAAVAQNPNIADLHIALGRNYRALQQYDKAVEEFSRANALNPSDALPLTYISRTYAAVGEYAKAIQYGQQAINITPDDAFLYGNLGVMYYRNRQYPEAIDALRLSVRGGKNTDGVTVTGLPLDYGRVAEYYYTYGLVLARQGQCGEAADISRLLTEGVPNDDVSVYNAQEMLNICKQGPGPTTTPTQEAGGTPAAKTQPKATVAATPIQ